MEGMSTMYESKYNKLLTIVLVIVIIAIICILSYFGYQYYKANSISASGSEFVNSFKNEVSNNNNETTNTNTDDISQENTAELDELLSQIQGTNTNSSSSGTTTKKTYQGYEVLGTIEIPATNVNYPILEYSTASITIAVGKLYGVNPNEVGNMCLASHNYRNGKLFSNNKKLSVGDVIYITDLSGNRVKYTIYKKYETTSEDTEYMTRDTEGRREISLSTCTDDSSARLIIWAKAD